MNDIENLYNDLKKELQSAQFFLDNALLDKGIWFLDIISGERHLTIEWCLQKGFGLWIEEPTPFCDPILIFKTIDEVKKRILEILSETN